MALLERECQEPGLTARWKAARLSALPGLAGKFMPSTQTRNLYQRSGGTGAEVTLQCLLANMKVELQVRPSDLQRVPAKGPVVVIANHPFGVLDGAVLAVLLARVRPDLRVLTHHLLAGLPELERECVQTDPFRMGPSRAEQIEALKESAEWLEQGGMLAMFPAGEVSHWQLPAAEVADPRWRHFAARLARKTGAAVLPVYFCGRNSVAFQVLGQIHPRLRSAFLLQEFLQRTGKTVEVRIGSSIVASSLASLGSDRKATEYLRSRTYLLARRGHTQPSLSVAMRAMLPRKTQQPIAAPTAAAMQMAELDSLPQARMLAENSEFAVWAARGREIPNLLRELGRLREITFREVGEGTGEPIDLDRFDDYYWHLLLWNKTQCELAGAYRAGNTAEIIAQHGIEGLYTSTLFRYDPRLFKMIGPALELGRSFVRPEYQRHFAPLLLLWKAIARYTADHPETPTLFGAVSISHAYSRESREMIVRYFESRKDGAELAAMIRPRTPFRVPRLQRTDYGAIVTGFSGLNELTQPIVDVEADGKGVPILLKQYDKLGGKLVGFNVDKKFSEVLDGLVVVDLRQTDRSVLERYMGRERVKAFRQYHRLSNGDGTPLTEKLAG